MPLLPAREDLPARTRDSPMTHDQLLLAVGCATAAACALAIIRRYMLVDPRLLGTWQSDGARTVGEWRDRRPLTDDQAAALHKLFGHMRITWWRRAYAVEMDGRLTTHTYRVIATDDRSVVLRLFSPVEGVWVFATVTFEDPDTYWVYAAGGPVREFFRRVDPRGE